MNQAELTPRARAKQEQIRTAAQRLFLRNGFAETSTDALASEAGVSKQTLYAYYPSKEALLSDVLRHLIGVGSKDPPSRSRRAVVTHDDLRRTVRGLAEKIVVQLMQPEYLALLRVIANETPRFPHLSELFKKSIPERLLGNVAALLTEARNAELVTLDDPSVGARMLVGPLLTYIILNGLLVPEEERKPPTRKELEQVVDLFLNGVSTAPTAG